MFAHVADTDVSQTLYNQIELRSATTKAGTYAVVATFDIDIDQEQTVYNHSAGASTTWYKIRYKDEEAGTYSGYSAPMQGAGWTTSSLGGITEAVLYEMHDIDAETYNRTHIARVANNCVRKLTLALSKLHLPILSTYATSTLTAATQMYDLPDSFLRFKKLEIAYDGSNYNRVTFESESEGLPDTTYYTNSPKVFRRGNKYGIRPYSTLTGSSTYRMWYDAYPTRMTDDDDEHGLPYGAENAIVPFIIYRLLAGNSEERATGYLREYQEARNDWLEAVSEGFQDYQPPVFKIRTDEDLYGTSFVDW